ncbi:MAG: DUF4255 domain-containing protein [Leptolyngbyaceae cyanobacterium CSU_1_3]|nr:DUF4255 domain-containing protein [Leptolyngbyaceae cyanobacterium CSU_1_3]
MSNSLAIAATTTTLRSLLFQGTRDELGSGSVTTRPLDKARGSNDGNQINLFLYHTAESSAWRNMDMPQQSKAGETSPFPLALELYYLVTAYGENDNDIQSHRLLGQAMSVLHDRAVLNSADIELATRPNEIDSPLFSSDLHRQIERIRIALLKLSFDEMSQIWRPFQAQYRISAAYQASIVLIESGLPVKTPLPVLRRGSEDRGAIAVAELPPSLLEIALANRKPSAELGDTLVIRGDRLNGENMTVRFRSVLSDSEIELVPDLDLTANEIRVSLPDASDATPWISGIYTVAVKVRRANLNWTTNDLPLALAPTVTNIEPSTAPRGDFTLTLTCAPAVRSTQRVTLLWGDREILADSMTPLSFRITNAQPGEYVIRLRVDRVDSIPVNFAERPLQFASNQKVRIL